MKKIIAMLCLLIIVSGCSKDTKQNKDITENTSVVKSSEKSIVPPTEKIGFTSKSILSSNFNELIKDDFFIFDTYNMESGSKVEVLSNEYKVIKIIIFTSEGEVQPSAFTVTAPEKSNSTIEQKYNDIITVLTNSISENSEQFITKFESNIDKYKFSSFIFDDEFLQNDLEKFFEEFILKYKVVQTNTDKNELPPNEHLNALSSARKYLKVSSFSKLKLKEQLIYEEYSDEAASYAVDNVLTDWNENAIKTAEKYLDLSSFSKDSLFDQLIHDGYTNEEAQQAIEKVYK